MLLRSIATVLEPDEQDEARKMRPQNRWVAQELKKHYLSQAVVQPLDFFAVLSLAIKESTIHRLNKHNCHS